MQNRKGERWDREGHQREHRGLVAPQREHRRHPTPDSRVPRSERARGPRRGDPGVGGAAAGGLPQPRRGGKHPPRLVGGKIPAGRPE